MVFLNPNFTGPNLLAYNFVGLAAIAFAVFLTASQPFYLRDVIGISPDKVGAASGTLGVVDELTALVVAPLSGALVDRVNEWAQRRPMPSGTRVVQLGSFLVLGLSLLGYGRWALHVFPDLWLFRALFAVGMCSGMSTAVVMLHEANNSDFTWGKLAVWRRQEYVRLPGDEVGESATFPAPPKVHKSHGKLSAVLGISTGVGAILSASVFIPLPVHLADRYPDLSAKDSLQICYSILGALALVVGVVVFLFSYDCVKKRGVTEHDELATLLSSYWELLREGIRISRDNQRLQLAYVGLFVARSTVVANAVFVPLMVFKYYLSTGRCGTSTRAEVPLKDDCYDGYIFLAILTGVAHTISLAATPVWGFMVDSRRCGYLVSLFAAACCGMLGSFGLCILGHGSEIYDPRNAGCFLAVGLIGVSQIGVVIISMSLISSAGHEHRVIGSISGLYSLSGAVGILLITKIGGSWSDHWVFGPFLILGFLNVILAIFSWRAKLQEVANEEPET